ncbi:orotidine-5'-phosphate decarboxylase, partial [Malacoplasma penetrans]
AGGLTMLNQAKQAVFDQNKNTKIIGITQLTSTSETEMQTQQKISTSLQDSVLNYAKLAKEANIDGVVSSVWETKKIKEQNGNNFLVINPGIRLEKDDSGDQKRVASPLDAKNQLADFIVVGRPITKDNNPLEKYLEIKRMFV